MPLAATLATNGVFQAFQGPSKLDALLHGHSYAGNPISCAVACEALSIFQVRCARCTSSDPDARQTAILCSMTRPCTRINPGC